MLQKYKKMRNKKARAMYLFIKRLSDTYLCVVRSIAQCVPIPKNGDGLFTNF